MQLNLHTHARTDVDIYYKLAVISDALPCPDLNRSDQIGRWTYLKLFQNGSAPFNVVKPPGLGIR
jgi:hypothetical protein